MTTSFPATQTLERISKSTRYLRGILITVLSAVSLVFILAPVGIIPIPRVLFGEELAFLNENPIYSKLILLAFFGFVAFRLVRVYWHMVEVHDGGDFLLIKQRDTEYELPLTEIEAVAYSRHSKFMTIELKWPGPMGDSITFLPEKEAIMFFKPALVSELNARIERANNVI